VLSIVIAWMAAARRVASGKVGRPRVDRRAMRTHLSSGGTVTVRDALRACERCRGHRSRAYQSSSPRPASPRACIRATRAPAFRRPIRPHGTRLGRPVTVGRGCSLCCQKRSLRIVLPMFRPLVQLDPDVVVPCDSRPAPAAPALSARKARCLDEACPVGAAGDIRAAATRAPARESAVGWSWRRRRSRRGLM